MLLSSENGMIQSGIAFASLVWSVEPLASAPMEYSAVLPMHEIVYLPTLGGTRVANHPSPSASTVRGVLAATPVSSLTERLETSSNVISTPPIVAWPTTGTMSSLS